MSITSNSLSAVSESLLSRHANGALAAGGSVADRPLLAGVAGRRSVITYLDNVKTTALDSRSERIKWQSVLICFASCGLIIAGHCLRQFGLPCGSRADFGKVVNVQSRTRSLI